MLSPMKAKEILNKLEKLGCITIRQKGSHVVLRKKDNIIIVPFH
jgi:predicted RNA binding protein YcfA (HicA-like mRNA interferase family)